MKPLKDREKKILWFLSQGMGYKQIAEQTGYAERTVRNSKEKLGRIFNTSSIQELVEVADERGFMAPTLEQMIGGGEKSK
jgi:DNA-binding NarL/FixJ family response regulator